MKRLFLLMALILGSCACEEKPTPTPTPIPEPEPEPTPVEEAVRVSFQSEITHVQPMTGIVLWNTSGSVKKDYVQLEYSYMLYNDVCKEKDVFDWTPMDKLLEQVAARGHQAVVRFRYTYPGYASAVPDYIKKMDGYEAIWAKADGRSREDTEYPDWRCEELRRFHMEFHRRFAERYDKDPRLAFVETGFGHWAEYHVYDGKYIDGQTFPSKEFQAEFLPKMDEWFKETPWLISIDASDSKYAPFRKQKELLDLNFGNFDDSFMCEDWDGYNWSCWTFFGKERYKKAPAGGEFSYYSSYDQKHVLDKEGMYGRVFEDVVAKVHMTFIIGNDQPGKQKLERITEAAMSMGYRFEVRDFKVLEGKSAEVLIANVGVAPIYRDAFVEVEGVRGDLNLRTLMPGDEALVTIACEAKTSSRPAIACDHLVEGQEIQYQADIKE
ncbi:MAG: DUF4832 domain-containing protein [Bacteroidales bacterium]|nr:DUF4832 domain-containing protein [Bacteroidales bacterium]